MAGIFGDTKMTEREKCPVCDTPLAHGRERQDDRTYFDCPRCGPFGLTSPAQRALDDILMEPRHISILSFGIRNTPPQGRETTLFDAETCRRIVDAGVLPTPREQGDRLIQWLGANLASPGDRLHLEFANQATRIGAQSVDGVLFVVNGLSQLGLLSAQSVVGASAIVTLTFAGWDRFEELRRGVPSSRRAFMAMQYGDTRLDRLVKDYFRVAVGETGFELRRLDDEDQRV